jgi:hypothetical protein
MKYRLRYRIGDPERGLWTREDAGEEHGLTDGLIIGSILYPPDGTLSFMFWTWDGRKENPKDGLDDTELFKVWTLLTMRLLQGEVDAGQRGLLSRVAQHIREFMLTRHGGAQ